MTHHHFVHWAIDHDHVTARWTCTAPVGSDCRLWCQRDCEDASNHTEECNLTDQGECLRIVWLNESDLGPEELYEGYPTELRSGPVELLWSGDDYSWQYPEEDAT